MERGGELFRKCYHWIWALIDSEIFGVSGVDERWDFCVLRMEFKKGMIMREIQVCSVLFM